MRPVAERILAAQQAADIQHYNDRYSSTKQVADAMERLQSRGDLPPVPTLVPGGDPDIWRSEPTVILGEGGPTPAQQVARLAEGLTARLPDLPPTDDPLLERLRAWRPER